MRPGGRRTVLLGLAGLATAMAVAACGLLPASGPAVRFDNLTNTPAAVYVNGGWVGTYQPGASVSVPIGGHGGPPYTITAHSPGGQELLRFVVTAPDVETAAGGTAGMAVGVDLPCGEMRMSLGPGHEDVPAAPVADGPICP